MTQVVVTFREYIPHRPTPQQPKGWREYAHSRMEWFLEQLACDNGGKRSHMEKKYPQELNSEEIEIHDTTDMRVIQGKVFVDWVNRIIIINDSTMNFWGHTVTTLYGQKKTARVKRVTKLVTVKTINERYGFSSEYADEECEIRISPQDKFSHACAFCGKVWGYKKDAENCSYTHVKYGLIRGDFNINGIEEIEIMENQK